MGFPWWLSDSIPGLGRSPGEAKGYPLQSSCLENPMDRGSLAGYFSWGHKESDTAERLTLHFTSWEDARIWAREVPPETDTSPSKGPLFHHTEYPAATLAPSQEHCVRACGALWLHPCQGPAPAGSRGTLRMNSVSEWEGVRQSWGLSLKFIFARPLYTLNNIFWGKCILLTHRASQNITATWPSTETGCHPHTFSFTGVFLIIWPSGLLTFYGLHLVWLKQLQ